MHTLALTDLVESLSVVIDLMSPIIANHQIRVTFIAQQLAQEAGLSQPDRHDLALAAMLHDAGAFSLIERQEIMNFDFDLDVEKARRHAEAGYLLLGKFPPFAGMARLIRYHHLPWEQGAGDRQNGGTVPLGSHILHLADRVDVLLHPQSDILAQVPGVLKKIQKKSGNTFHPGLVAHLSRLAEKESFWFGIESIATRTGPRRLEGGAAPAGMEDLIGLAQLFAQLIDFRSRFTATHSSGVAACASKLVELMGFEENDCRLMMVAGYLHDLGKMAVPPEIVDKKTPLTRAETNLLRRHSFYTYTMLYGIRGLETVTEWASLHHERLNGRGYPFHVAAGGLSPGARAMAVADVFTATMEDRPYRKGMTPSSVIGILERMAASEVLDAGIVGLLMANFQAVDEARAAAQRQAREEYEHFCELTVKG